MSGYFDAPGWYFDRTVFHFHWWFKKRTGSPLWWLEKNPGSPLWWFMVPIWVFVVFALVPTFAAWRLDALARRRARVSLCPACNYNRRGIPAASVCPECGAVPAGPPQAST
jgi:hypothetical protein